MLDPRDVTELHADAAALLDQAQRVGDRIATTVARIEATRCRIVNAQQATADRAAALSDRIADVARFLERARAGEPNHRPLHLATDASLLLEVTAIEGDGWKVVGSLLFRDGARSPYAVQLDAFRRRGRTEEHYLAVESGRCGVDAMLRCALQLAALTRAC